MFQMSTNKSTGEIELRRLVNIFGQVPVYEGLPDSLCHIKDERALAYCNRWQIPHARALTGFDSPPDSAPGKAWCPILSGIVIPAEHARVLQLYLDKHPTGASTPQGRAAEYRRKLSKACPGMPAAELDRCVAWVLVRGMRHTACLLTAEQLDGLSLRQQAVLAYLLAKPIGIDEAKAQMAAWGARSKSDIARLPAREDKRLSLSLYPGQVHELVPGIPRSSTSGTRQR